MKRGVLFFAVTLVIANPAFAETVIHTKDGRTIKVPVEANEIARIEFVAGQNEEIPSFLQTLTTGKERSGEAWAGSGRWKFGLKITSYDRSTGVVGGEISWPSLSSVHRIEGKVTGEKLTFTEVEAIQAGSAHLNVTYVFTLGKKDATGTWVDNRTKDHGEAKIK
jgi:hypothetical protein